jgi:hypothetical protein
MNDIELMMAKYVGEDKPQHNVEFLDADDAHWYRQKGQTTWLPSVSGVLAVLKDGMEFVSPYELRLASERGVKVHHATEMLEQGQQLDKKMYTTKEWDMIGGFTLWYREMSDEYGIKPVLIEHPFANHKLGFGGTLDRLYLIGDALVLVDLKTTSAIQPKHWKQVSAYTKLCKEEGHDVATTAILRLTDKTKSKYQYKESDRSWKTDYKLFEHCLALYQDEHGDKQPKESQFGPTLSLELPPF